jgi:Secretion system C-terminal sorting domain
LVIRFLKERNFYNTKTLQMKKQILHIIITCICFTATAQPCVETAALTPLPLQYTFDGRPGTSFDVIQSNWNRIYKLDATTGLLTAEGCIFAGNSLYGACVCYLQGTYFRRVTPPCDPTPCGGDLPLPGMPLTNTNNSSVAWSQAGTWIANQVPDAATAAAIVLNKATQIDAALHFFPNHWLVVANGSSTILAGTTVTNNSMIQVYPAATLENRGTLKGSGKVFGSLVNSGILSPGNSPGKFTITGNYTATASAVHDIEIASTGSYDTISVAADVSFASGNAGIGGALQVRLLDGFVPSAGDAFKIMTFASLTGSFSSTSLPVLPAGLSWSIEYNATDITLKVNAVLPLHFISVKADTKNSGVQVSWVTADEIDVNSFDVERSVDGIDFRKAGSQKAMGGNAHYEWFDANPAPGVNYYRIKANDADGKFMYSAIKAVKTAGIEPVSVYPNPAKSGTMIHLRTGNSTPKTIQIVNLLGELVYTGSFNTTGSMSILLPASLSPGLYIVKLFTGNKVETKKIQVQ